MSVFFPTKTRPGKKAQLAASKKYEAFLLLDHRYSVLHVGMGRDMKHGGSYFRVGASMKQAATATVM